MELFDRIKVRVLLQIVFWIGIFGVLNLMLLNTEVPYWVYYRNFLHAGMAVLIVLLNTYLFIPRLFARKRYGAYVISVLGSVLLLIVGAAYIEDYVLPNGRTVPADQEVVIESAQQSKPTTSRTERAGPPPGALDVRYFINFVLYSAVFLVGAVVESVQLNRKQEQIANQVQHEKMVTELKFLKSQINPHFLFNVLNNVYSLSIIQSEQTPEVVMKLSEMLRYMLYESNQDRVTLEQEIKYIENYIALQQLKDDKPLAVEVQLDIAQTALQIAPMMLIPFVENAFKHSKIEDTENGWIKIQLQATRKELRLNVANSLAGHSASKDATGGIGLHNVQRRLELEYADRHSLSVVQADEQFNIHLVIQLA